MHYQSGVCAAHRASRWCQICDRPVSVSISAQWLKIWGRCAQSHAEIKHNRLGVTWSSCKESLSWKVELPQPAGVYDRARIHKWHKPTGTQSDAALFYQYIVLGSMQLSFSGLIITNCMEGRNTPVQLQSKVLAPQCRLNERMFVSGSVGFGAERIWLIDHIVCFLTSGLQWIIKMMIIITVTTTKVFKT